MDPITQGLLGGVAAQAVQRRPVERYVIWAGIAGGMLPDLDILIRSPSDPMLSIAYHRHFTHALAFIPLGGLIAAALFWWLTGRRHPFARVYLAATAGYATHGLLDACTTYGTVLLWPFSSERISWDLISIIDPIFSLLLLLGLAWAWLRSSAWPARVALLLAFGYLGLGFWQHQQVLKFQEEVAQSRGHDRLRSRAYPSFGNLLVWRSFYEHDGRLYIDAIRRSFRGKTTLWPGGSVPLFSENNLRPPPAAGSTLDHDLKIYTWFAEHYLAKLGESPWILGDMRFALLPNATRPLWGIAFSTEDPTRHVKKIRFPGERLQNFDLFWGMVTGALPSLPVIPNSMAPGKFEK